MPHLVKCHLCLTEMSMSDDIFARRIAGRKVSLKCRHCTSTIIVDATGGNTAVLQSTSRHEAPAVGAKATSTPVAKAPTTTPVAAVAASPTPPANEPSNRAPGARALRADSAVKPATEAATPDPRTTAVTTKIRAIAPVAAPPRRNTPFGGIPAVAPVAAAPRRNTPFGGIPAQSPPVQAPPRVVTPPPFPAVSPAPQPDDAQEVSVAELLPVEPSAAPAQASPALASAPADEVQEVSVVDLIPAEPPPVPARRAAMETLPDVVTATAPAPPQHIVPTKSVPIEAHVSPPAPEPQATLPFAAMGVSDTISAPREPATSPFAQTVAYGPDSDSTPGAFGFQEPPPAPSVALETVESAPVSPPSRRAWPKRAAVAAVALLVAAGTAFAVVRSGALARVDSAQAAAPTVETKTPSSVAAVAPSPAITTAPAAAPAAPSVAPEPAPAESSPAAVDSSPSTPEAAAALPGDGSGPLPAYVSEPGVRFLTRVAVQRAERTCHRRGRAVGKARVFATFMPNGRVSQARVEGEPIESAPVARCIKDQLYAVVIPKFNGAPFTVSEPITLY